MRASFPAETEEKIGNYQQRDVEGGRRMSAQEHESVRQRESYPAPRRARSALCKIEQQRKPKGNIDLGMSQPNDHETAQAEREAGEERGHRRSPELAEIENGEKSRQEKLQEGGNAAGVKGTQRREDELNGEKKRPLHRRQIRHTAVQVGIPKRKTPAFRLGLHEFVLGEEGPELVAEEVV